MMLPVLAALGVVIPALIALDRGRAEAVDLAKLANARRKLAEQQRRETQARAGDIIDATEAEAARQVTETEAEAEAEIQAAREALQDFEQGTQAAAQDILDTVTLPDFPVAVLEPVQEPPPAPPEPAPQPRVRANAATVNQAMRLLGMAVPGDLFDATARDAFRKLAARLGLSVGELGSADSGATALIAPPATWEAIKTAASEAKAAQLAEPPPAPPEPEPEPAPPLAVVEPAPSPAPLRPREAAQALFEYVGPIIRAGNAHTLGDAAGPNLRVQELQRGMGKIKADGIYGPGTRARGKELLGREFPARTAVKRVAPAPPTVIEQPSPDDFEALPGATRAPAVAARALYDYATTLVQQGKARQLGSKGAPNTIVKQAQEDMGGLVADGIYGPGTRARGKELTGLTFPARQ